MKVELEIKGRKDPELGTLLRKSKPLDSLKT